MTNGNSFLLMLILITVFLNGATDAVNSIASCVGTKCMKMSSATVMSAVFNCLGVIIMGHFFTSVADTFGTLVSFSDDSTAKTALSASVICVILWACITWVFGIPTSESHALAASLVGASLAVNTGAVADTSGLLKVLYGLIISTLAGGSLGFLISRFVHRYLAGTSERFFKKAQIFGACCSSFMHGGQDGLKFAGLLMISSDGVPHTAGVFLIGLIMFLGTWVGGKKIVRSVGEQMVTLDKKDGFSADIASAVCLFIGSVSGGIPMSTTHTKTSALLGAGKACGGTVDRKTVSEMILAWVCTFPACGVLAYFVTKIMI